MTWFVVIAAAMAAIALAWVLPGLLRSRDAGGAVQSRASNLAILKDQLRELADDLAAGTLSPEQYLQAREDLERRALEETRDGGDVPAAQPFRARRTVAALAVAIPLVAAALYWQLGTPDALIAGSGARSPGKKMPPEVEAMVAKLEARMQTSPDDANGWALLGRSYMVMQRFPEAIAAYERAAALMPDDADFLADYADSLAVAHGGRLEGKPLQLIERALTIDPTQWKALALAGTAAFNRKDFRQAIDYWTRLLSRAEPGSEMARAVASNIEEARELGGFAAPAKAPARADEQAQRQAATATVTGTVALSAQLAGKAAPTDTVFVFARAAEGPRMPLAILRFKVGDLPAKFSVDDSMAMSPAMKLSNHADVVIGARVSKSANAAPQTGDLQGFSTAVKVGAVGVRVVIDQVVP